MWNRRKVTDFCLPINSLFFIYKIYNLVDEEINVLFIDMLCLRTLKILIFEVVKASIVRHFVRSSLP